VKFNLGAPTLKVDLQGLIDSRLLIQANSGGGKSWCVRYVLEQTHGHIQQLVIDPEGEFGTLREKLDYVYAAKAGGDTAVHPRVAKLLAERLLELGVSAILDIYELKPHERVSFVRLFLEAMIDAPKKLWHPVLVVLDEAHVYCPQKGEAESASAVNDLCTRGRKRGFCAVLATQRLSKLHKDAAAELNNKLIGRCALDVDMARASEELGFTTREQRLSLRLLPKGDFYAFGPAITEEPTRVHIGDVISRHPEAGSRIAFTPAPPTEKVKALLPKLSDLPKEAEERQRSEADLRQEVANLRRQLTLTQRAQPPAPKVEKAKTVTIDRPVITHAQIQRLEKAAKQFQEATTQLGYKVDWLDNQIVRPFLASFMDAGKLAVVEKPGRQVVEVPRHVTRLPAGARAEVNEALGVGLGRAVEQNIRQNTAAQNRMLESDSGLGKGERACLIAIAQHLEGVTREQLTVLTGYKRSTRDTYIQRLSAGGRINLRGELIFASDEGVAVLGGDYQPLPTGDELREHWLRRLPEGERKVLEVAIETYPEPVARDAISDATGYARSSRDTYLQRLGARKLVESVGSDVRASAMLFGNGR
jgi:hypothetical protein